MAETKAKAKPKHDTARKDDAGISNAEAAAEKKEERPIEVKKIDPEEYVTVRNGFYGRLIYKSSRTGERFIWDRFGDEQEMTLRELRNARNNNKKFFENNWFLFDEDWIVSYLGVRQYYSNSLSADGFDELFTKSAEELKYIIGGMNKGQKKSVAYRAMEMIANGWIDSRKTIAALEEALGLELTEK